MMDVRERKLAVARGYERIAERYAAAKEDCPAIQDWIDRLAASVPAGGRIADLGCGAAAPYTARLARRFAVVGMDIARAQLRLARANVPAGRLVQGDLCTLPFAAETFDGALSLYAVIHVPRMEHIRVLAEAQRVLRRGAPLLVVMGSSSLDDAWEEYHGVPMHWSHFGAEMSRRLIAATGFSVERSGLVADRDGGAHAFILARRT